MRGIFDGFESYATPTIEDYRRVFSHGLIVLDANVLLNLYRYTAETRDDLLAVLERLADRLWVPHQVLVEFWRNRESVLRDPRDTERTANELSRHQEAATKAFRTWANRVSLPSQQADELLGELGAGFRAVINGVHAFADESAKEAVHDTDKDGVLQSLNVILGGHIGPPMDEAQHAAAVAEGMRRIKWRRPPGYMDKGKDDESAAGDYLVWEQTLLEAQQRNCDVLLVTGDVKEDWWREEGGERRGPRIELGDELRRRTGRRMFMLRPNQLLSYAKSILEIGVRDESVRDADRVEELLSGKEWLLDLVRRALPSGWSIEDGAGAAINPFSAVVSTAPEGAIGRRIGIEINASSKYATASTFTGVLDDLEYAYDVDPVDSVLLVMSHPPHWEGAEFLNQHSIPFVVASSSVDIERLRDALRSAASKSIR